MIAFVLDDDSRYRNCDVGCCGGSRAESSRWMLGDFGPVTFICEGRGRDPQTQVTYVRIAESKHRDLSKGEHIWMFDATNFGKPRPSPVVQVHDQRTSNLQGLKFPLPSPGMLGCGYPSILMALKKLPPSFDHVS